MVMNFASDRHPGNNTTRSQIVFAITSIALSLAPLSTRLLGFPAQSLIETVSTLVISLSLSRQGMSHALCLSLSRQVVSLQSCVSLS